MQNLKLLRLKQVPILTQLLLEEALLRTTAENWIVVNSGAGKAVVMGLGAKVDSVVDRAALRRSGVPLIRRYTGGGTVVVDDQTVFTSFLLNQEDTNRARTPKAINEHTFDMLKPVFGESIVQQENDYVWRGSNRKVGGIAQSIIRDRWCHHVSWLWDYKDENMAFLKHPEKTPVYRAERDHLDFLLPLAEVSAFDSLEEFVDALISNFEAERTDEAVARTILKEWLQSGGSPRTCQVSLD